MKKTIVLISTIILFAGLTFGQAQQKQDKTTTPAKKEATTTTPAKDPKAGCDKKDMEKCNHGKDAKGCCSHGNKAETKDTKAPVKK